MCAFEDEGMGATWRDEAKSQLPLWQIPEQARVAACASATPGFLHVDVRFDARRVARDVIHAKEHGNQHVAKLHGLALAEWMRRMRAVPHRPVPAVSSPLSLPTKLKYEMCLRAHGHVCGVAGVSIQTIRKGLNAALKTEFRQGPQRESLESCDVVAVCFATSVPDDAPAFQGVVVSLAATVNKKTLEVGWGLFQTVDDGRLLEELQRDAEDLKLLAKLPHEGPSIELVFHNKGMSTWDLARLMDPKLKWEVC